MRICSVLLINCEGQPGNGNRAICFLTFTRAMHTKHGATRAMRLRGLRGVPPPHLLKLVLQMSDRILEAADRRRVAPLLCCSRCSRGSRGSCCSCGSYGQLR